MSRPSSYRASSGVMRISPFIGLLMCLAVPGLHPGLRAAETASDPDTAALTRQFADPPDTARPWVYWFWIGGQVNHAAITPELEGLKRQGVAGVLVFTVDLLRPVAVFGQPKVCWSPEWDAELRFAAEEARRLGLGFCFQYDSTSAGCGGPWITVDQSGEDIVWSGTVVEGGKKQTVRLPQPEVRDNFYHDVAVLAYPLKTAPWDSMRLAAPKITLSSQDAGIYGFGERRLLDGDPDSFWLSQARGKKGEFIDLVFPAPYTAASLYLDPRSGWSPTATEVQVSENGKDWRSVTQKVLAVNQASITAFPTTSSAHWRILFPSAQSADGRIGVCQMRLLAPGEDTSRILSPSHFFAEQIANQKDTRAGWAAMLAAGDPDRKAPVVDAAPGDVLDLSRFLQPDGTLNWDAPPGSWEVLRFGRTSMGALGSVNCAPFGYHVDYLDASTVNVHFEKGVDPLIKAMGSNDLLTRIHEDSFETEYNRWTGAFPQRFRELRGYDPALWLPVLAGRVIGSQALSERFLWDYRRTIADLYEEHWAMAQKLSHDRGMIFQSEAAGPEPFCMDGLAQLGRTDLPMGEFWSTVYQPGVPLDKLNRGCWWPGGGIVETIRLVASAAHTYGKPLVKGESFTGYCRPFVLDPFDVKAFGDRAFADGLNHNTIHLYIHQPTDTYQGLPVVARIHAVDFNRRSTWFEQSKVWTDYLGRCCHLLQQGRPVQDVAYFVGEGAPAYVPPREMLQPELPPAYDFDGINAEVLLTATVKDGRVTLPSGANYALLVMPPWQRALTPAMAKQVQKLVEDGAVVWGPKPDRSPSLADATNADLAVRGIADAVWGPATTPEGENKYGKGRVIWGRKLDDVLPAICPPAFTVTGADPKDVLDTERSLPGMDIFFISNQTKKAVDCTVDLRSTGTRVETWDPVTGKSELAGLYRQVSGGVEVPLSFAPRGSIFVMVRNGATPSHVTALSRDGQPVTPAVASVQTDGTHLTLLAWEPGSYVCESANAPARTVEMASVPPPVNLTSGWTLTFPGKAPMAWDGLKSWTESDQEEIRCFSGIAVYQCTFTLPEVGKRVDLDMGQLKNLAEVTVNGQKFTTLWTPPFRLNVTTAVHPGKNTIKVAITNLLVNRITGDFFLPPEKRHIAVYGAVDQYRAGAAKDGLMPSGLFGPVRILSAVESPLDR